MILVYRSFTTMDVARTNQRCNEEEVKEIKGKNEGANDK